MDLYDPRTQPPPRPSTARDSYLALMILIIVGLPVFVFLNIITAGLFLYMALVGGVLAMLGGLHYLLWGRALKREAEIEELLEDNED